MSKERVHRWKGSETDFNQIQLSNTTPIGTRARKPNTTPSSRPSKRPTRFSATLNNASNMIRIVCAPATASSTDHRRLLSPGKPRVSPTQAHRQGQLRDLQSHRRQSLISPGRILRLTVPLLVRRDTRPMHGQASNGKRHRMMRKRELMRSGVSRG